ncbi:PTS fructose transporter subunit IIABC [Alkalicoccobacillus murimartini]|uniref:PTS system fructose-specific IIC component n=1 Tax=Alkalicoccobacillus murimartini TaxID=171685 RepID=A0ABT9YKD6_9BACI|nr:fructose-specific PTS transporter subunit EIIC [Alkalicoccobacillus murimartini]MDQ0208327.1 PTS system fructose-specific IIC component [Alkalicoccobacillus murimartini]
MKISELLKKDTMILNLKASTKDAVIDELVNKLSQAGRLNDKQAYKEAILAREAQSTTGLGEGIAIPHAKTSAVRTPAIGFGRSKAGIDYEALDGQPSQLFFMIAASEGANNEHLATLSRLTTFLMDDEFRQTILHASTEEEILSAIDQKDAEKEAEEAAEAEAEAAKQSEKASTGSTSSDSPRILGVTGCPTGIAHTYMAADALKSKAAELGISIKVETNGSGGVKNKLTAAEIEAADAIIVAADTKIEMDRFAGKKVIQAPVADGVRKPKDLIDRALSENAPIYKGSGNAGGGSDSSDSGKKGLGIYKHIMNGVSNMLPFVIGGGILIALSFLFGGINAEGTFAEMLDTIGGGTAFKLLVPVLAAFIAMSIADRPGFAPGLVAGMIAMNGEAGFLGGLIAGFLAGYIALLVRKLINALPQILQGIGNILFTPVLNLFVSGMLMLLLVAPLASINLGLQNWLSGLGTANMIILGVILGGMMAVDMGGPVNKAAFTFGIAMIEAGNLAPHAAVMAGGMAPPIGIALATTFFRSKFSKKDRQSGLTNYLLGLSFITEGAIPFAAADPLRVIPAAIAGSALAGGLTAFFGILLPAPHGGIFVMGLVNSPPVWSHYAFLYLLAVVLGAILTAILLGILKKKVVEE